MSIASRCSLLLPDQCPLQEVARIGEFRPRECAESGRGAGWPSTEAQKPTFREQIIAAFKAQFDIQTGRELKLSLPDEILVKVKDRFTEARFYELYTTWVLTSDHCVYDLVLPEPFELWPRASFSAHFIDADYGFLSP